MRRRFGWLGALLVLVAGVSLLVVLLPGRAAPPEGPRLLGGYEPPEPEKPVRRSNRQLVGPLQTAEKFITTAVMRKNVDESWEVVAPSFPGKSEYTRTEWAKGDIPVVPFPVKQARWRLDYSFTNEVGLVVALLPREGSDEEAAIFNIDLRAYGTGQNRRWLVENYGPAGSGNISTSPGRGSFSPSGFPDLSPVGEKRLASTWILVPLGILGLALLVPIILVIGYIIRARRAEREFAQTAR